jgi:tRNA 2-thiouridine synthesizing protein A
MLSDPAREVDACGLLCPLPVLRARKVILGLQPGELLRLLATDPAAVIDVPHFAREGGHEFLGSEEREGGVTAYLLRRGA